MKLSGCKIAMSLELLFQLQKLPVSLVPAHIVRNTHLGDPLWCQAASPVTSQLLKWLPNKQMPVYQRHLSMQFSLLQDTHTHTHTSYVSMASEEMIWAYIHFLETYSNLTTIKSYYYFFIP